KIEGQGVSTKLISLSDESGALIPPAEYPTVFNNVFSNSFSVGDGNVFYDVPRCEFSQKKG
ncbi:MAG: hypothetical protein O7D30_00840, partial [Rickettsia endosymbiont of Ixodes persulcatus]|nr:hypothetical protein [Rickettsia endosymbiont of Ixodes persulcatus]